MTVRLVLPFAIAAALSLFWNVDLARAGNGTLGDDGGLELELNFRFPPTEDEIAVAREQIQRSSQFLCDATEGQVHIEHARLVGAAAREDLADLWWHLKDDFRSNAPLGGIGRNDAHINLSTSGIRASTVVHELGHYLFWLSEQYDEQRRLGGPCGIGRGFELNALDERNNSIMQQARRESCVYPTSSCTQDADCAPDHCEVASGLCFTKPGCMSDSECPTGTECRPLLNSEFSVSSNHDPVRSDGDVCPAPRAATELVIGANLRFDAPIVAFDPDTFETAKATAIAMDPAEVLDSKGEVEDFFEGESSHKLFVYAERLEASLWRLHFGIDDGAIVMGTEGDLRIVGTVDLSFDAGVIDTVTPDPPVITIADLASEADDIVLDLVFDSDDDGTDEVFESSFPSSDIGMFSRGAVPSCKEADCAARWNATTLRWETSAQSLANDGKSDWQTIVDKYSFLQLPPGMPDPDPPGSCQAAVDFDEDIVGVDRVALVIDRSGSMFDPVGAPPEGIGDGGVARIEYAAAAARAFIDLFAGRGGDLAIISFNEIGLIIRGFEGESETFDLAEADGAKMDMNDNILPGGQTAIGNALGVARLEFERAGDGRVETVFLLSDGENNKGPSPTEAAEKLRERGVQIFSIPVGSAADRKLLKKISSDSGGDTFDAPVGDELPAIYAELFARTRGETLTLPRTESEVLEGIVEPVVQKLPASTQADRTIPFSQTFDIPVEAGAEQLNVFVSSRNLSVATWNPRLILRGPAGEEITEDDESVRRDSFYRLFQETSPTPGTWTLEVQGRGGFVQRSYLLGHVENAAPDCFVSATPRIATGGPVTIRASASFRNTVENALYSGVVIAPSGAVTALAFEPDPEGGRALAEFDAIAGRGIYSVHVTCSVPEGARSVPGESIFDGPRHFPELIEPFRREGRIAFMADVPDLPVCSLVDCDFDGLPGAVEGTSDPDGDGLPADRDDDADGDDIPDEIEGAGDSDGDGTPDFLDTDSDDDGISDADEGSGDTDGDGTPDFRDLDSDGDGIPDADEGTGDPDDDGLPNFRDSDSDGDGIADGDDPFPYSACGNTVIEPGEECDDGNRDDGDRCSALCTIENEPPVCDEAVADPDRLWPPNHGLISVAIAGVTDADGDSVQITTTQIFQDEPIDARGDGHSQPDATGLGTDTPSVRAERSGQANGRVYRIHFEAEDSFGGGCSGQVTVCVPHDRGGKKLRCVDDGPLYESTSAAHPPDPAPRGEESNRK